ncbi:MAG: arylsulfatase A-like enzyme [Pseudohongiellaceae bacterium]
MTNHNSASVAAPSLIKVASFGALLGGLSAAWLVALQTASAVMAEMLWTVDDAGLNGVVYPLAGALAGALLSLFAELFRRVALPRVDAFAFTGGCLALAGYAGRAGVTALLRGRQDWFGGRVGALVVQGLVVVMLGVVTITWMHRRQRRREHSRLLPLLLDGLGIALCTVSAALFVHLHWLAIKEQALVDGLLGPMALVLTALAGAVGVAAGFCVAAPLANWSLAARGRVAAGGVMIVFLLGIGLADQRPPTARASSARKASGPNVILIVLDTLRRDAVSAYGEVEGSTPVLDAFAEDGVLWEDCLANGSWTIPSHASLFTGAEVGRHGAGHARKRLREQPAGEGTMPLYTLAEMMGRNGWHTAAYVSNMNVSRANGFDRGFAEYQEIWRARQGDYDVLGPARRAWLADGVFDKGGELCLKGSREWLAAHRDDERPWFLFVNFMEPHSPYYQAPERFARAYLKEGEPTANVQAIIGDTMAHVYHSGVSDGDAEELWRVYLGGVAYQDWLLGELLSQLEDQGLAEDTLVVITSDHGETFGWHGLLGHGQDVNEALVAVPLMARGPGVPSGVRDHTPVSLVDIMPTVLSLVDGKTMPPDPGRTGVALLGGDAVNTAELSDRIRWVEKYPMFLHELDEYSSDTRDGELAWAWGRRGVYHRGTKLVLVNGDVSEELSPRLTSLSDEAVAPLDDGRRGIHDKMMRPQLNEAINAPPWTPAIEPDALILDDEDDLAGLRELGYVGNQKR